jgi:hypothetical protein
VISRFREVRLRAGWRVTPSHWLIADVQGCRPVGGTFTHSSRRYYEAEGVGQFVAADLLAVYHPGPRPEFVVECEQPVVDQIAEITGDVDAAELPVDDRQIDMRHEAQGLASVAPRRYRQYR